MDPNAPRQGHEEQVTDGAGADPRSESTRRFRATQLRPRVEFGRREQPPTDEPERPLIPEVLDAPPGNDVGGGGPVGGSYGGGPFGGGPGDAFAPREFAGGRVRVYGCSPGCLIASILISLFLTLLLNAIV